MTAGTRKRPLQWRRGGGLLSTGSSEKQMWWTSVRPGLTALNQSCIPTVNFKTAAVDPTAAPTTCVSWRPRAINYFKKPTAGFYWKGQHFPPLSAQRQTSDVASVLWSKGKASATQDWLYSPITSSKACPMYTFALVANEEKWTFCGPHWSSRTGQLWGSSKSDHPEFLLAELVMPKLTLGFPAVEENWKWLPQEGEAGLEP